MAVLSESEHRQFLECGYLVLRGLVSSELAAAALQAVCEGPEEERDARDPAVLACIDGGVGAAVGELFGDVPHELAQLKYRPRPYRPEAPRGLTGHIDSHYPTLLPEGAAIGGMVFLNQVPSQGGAFCIRPGSPRLVRHQMLAGYPEFMRRSWRKNDGLEEVLAEPGDVVIFQFHMAHSASPNTASPAGRHAIDFRFSPTVPLTGAATAPLSTLQKAYSMAFVAPDHHSPGRGTLPGHDVGTEARTLLAHAELRDGGKVHRLVVDQQAPSSVVHEVSDDLTRWSLVRTVHAATGPLQSVGLIWHEDGITATVATDHDTVILQGEDLPGLQVVAHKVRPTYVFWSSKATAPALKPYVAYQPAEDGTIRWSAGDKWDALEDGGVAADLGTPGRAIDVMVAPILGDRSYAMIVDRAGGQGSPMWSRSPDPTNFGGFAPLDTTAKAPVRQIRLHDRVACHTGECHWLVTFLDATGMPRWGVLDWTTTRPLLAEITSAEEFDDALALVGLR